jgi:hypothetical protein
MLYSFTLHRTFKINSFLIWYLNYKFFVISELYWKMMLSPEWKKLSGGTSQASTKNLKDWRNHTIQSWEKLSGAIGSILMVLGHSTWLNRWTLICILTFDLIILTPIILMLKVCKFCLYLPQDNMWHLASKPTLGVTMPVIPTTSQDSEWRYVLDIFIKLNNLRF